MLACLFFINIFAIVAGSWRRRLRYLLILLCVCVVRMFVVGEVEFVFVPKNECWLYAMVLRLGVPHGAGTYLCGLCVPLALLLSYGEMS